MYNPNQNKHKRFEKRIWLSTPTMYPDSMEYAMKAYETNWMSTVGENINEIELIAKERVGAKYAVALSCGTSALHLAIKLAGVKPGDKVFCTDMTFAATVNPVMYEGCVPVFIDTEYDTWNMDPKSLEKAFKLYPEVKVIVAVHLYGTPCRMDEIKSIADRYGAVIVEDAAESFGATYKGKQTGILGDLGCISFNGNKIITGSCGGMLFTNSERDACLARKWSTQSRENAPWYQHVDLGYNYRMSNVVAGIVRNQLPRLDEHIAAKKRIYERYRDGLSGLPVKMNPFDPENSEPNFWLSCMIIDESAMCRQERSDGEAHYVPEKNKSCPTEILEALEKYNAEGRPIWKPMHLQPIYKEFPFVTRNGNGTLDVGTDIFNRGLCLPSDNKMTEEEQDTVIDIIRSCFD